MNLLILMSPTAEQYRRMDDSSGLPKWFGYPFMRAFSNVGYCHSVVRFVEIALRKTIRREKLAILIFNISGYTALCFVLAKLLGVKVVSLYQWRPFNELSLMKRLIYWVVCRFSDVLAVYSGLHRRYLLARFPKQRIVWVGLYTDESFYSPLGYEPLNKYILVPGNHLRDDDALLQIASKMDIDFVRMSNDRKVKDFYSLHQMRNIELAFDVDYSSVRGLYHNCICVLNLCNDGSIPAGITTFCEAISMNKVVVTPDGHSCSGYESGEGNNVFVTVPANSSHDDWIDAVHKAMNLKDCKSRNVALEKCSLNATVQQWSGISEMLS